VQQKLIDFEFVLDFALFCSVLWKLLFYWL
jgi:hypothetical protein